MSDITAAFPVFTSISSDNALAVGADFLLHLFIQLVRIDRLAVL